MDEEKIWDEAEEAAKEWFFEYNLNPENLPDPENPYEYGTIEYSEFCIALEHYQMSLLGY